MAGTGLKGLKGLKGIAALSDADYNKFVANNRDVIARHGYDPSYIAGLYQNKQFLDKYGEEAFDALPNARLRNEMFRQDTINEEFNKRYNLKFNKNGMSDNDFQKYSQLSTDAKLKLMESGYLTPSEFESQWKKEQNKIAKVQEYANSGFSGFLRKFAMGTDPNGMYTEPSNYEIDWNNESSKKIKLDANSKILTNIFNDDVDTQASQYSDQVAKAYYELYGMSDNAIKKMFIKEITRGSYTNSNGMPNMGISQYQAFYGNGKDVKSEMANFSIDDMREVLAKKKVYEANMSPDMAMTALDNDARRYIHSHQGKLDKLGDFAKDVAISSMSYTADKVNGIAEVGRMIEDGLAKTGAMAKPVVWMDDAGNIIDMKKTKTFKGKNGALMYTDTDGKNHYLHQTQIGYSALHQLGKDTDGSDLEGAFGRDWLTLNSQYWSRAEQFGTLDKDLQKQYEKIGASPYKVVYNPGDDSDLIYEGFKMMSFGLADQAAMFIPFGIGAMGRGIQGISKAGNIINRFGKMLDVTGTFLSASKPAQVTNGIAGAAGIAYAYGRGAFQETLAENLANAEEAMTDKVKQGIYDRYQNDKKYKASIDAMVTAEAAKMKQEYKAQVQKDSGTRILDEKTIDKMLRAKAQDKVMASQIEAGIDEAKASGEYADAQGRAINSAGNTALNSYWPEAIKYGLINTFGHRKFLYQNPSGVTRKISSSLKGIKEITTKDGAKRLVADAPKKFQTWKQKSLEFGKTAASQIWGGAWTNGSDDMMVDAAERINHDSYSQYLEAYKNGEAAATTYGLVDGIFSYMKGLQNSLGQESTWNSAVVGALGSVINVAPNFTNIASLMTKEGRQNYKNQFWRTQKRDENGMPLKNPDGTLQYETHTKKDKDGNPITTDIKKRQQLLGQLNFFLQNGVLNDYFGKKMSERDLQNHADYVNGILDQYDDFKDIEGLVAANLAAQNIGGNGNVTTGDKKTINFLQALYSMKMLSNLGNKSDDPTSMSSVVQQAKETLDLASRADAEGKDALTEEEATKLLGQYYAANPSVAQSEESAREGLDIIAKNAKILTEARERLAEAEKQVGVIEKNLGKPLDPQVKTKYLINAALNDHWQERVEQMKSEIGDSSDSPVLVGSFIDIAAVGGKRNANALMKVYGEQIEEIDAALEKDKENEEKAMDEYHEALKAAQKEEKGTAKRIEADKKAEEAKVKYESIQQEIKYKNDLRHKTNQRRNLLSNAFVSSNSDIDLVANTAAQAEYDKAEAELKMLEEKKKAWYDSNGKVKKGHNKQVETANKEIENLKKTLTEKRKELDTTADRVLDADEIMSLDSVTRARMMNKENRDLYSNEQIAEIEKLEKRLTEKDPDALQKIQDIALLTQRIENNRDANWRMMENPEAAAYAVEMENERSAASAYQLINKRTAESIQDYLQRVEEIAKQHDNVTEEMKNEYIFNILKRQKYSTLEALEKQNMIPQFSKQLSDAKDYTKTINDIVSIVANSKKSEEEKQNLLRNLDVVANRSHTKAEILTNLEKIIDEVEDPNAVSDFQYILENLESLGYQRDATVIESREKKKEREEAAKKKREADKKKADDDAKAAAEKKVIEDAQKKAAAEAAAKNGTASSDAEEAFKKQQEDNAQPGQEVPADGKGLTPKTEAEDVVDQDMTDAVQKGDAGAWSVQLMVDAEDADKASIDAGEVWATDKSNPHKESVTVEKDGNTYTINTGGKPYTLFLGKEYHEMPEGATEENFNVTSFEKKGDDWYLNGTFADSNEKAQVKATDKFDMDYAVEQLRGERESYAATEGIDSNKNIIVEEDTVSGNSESVADQAIDSQAEGANVQISDDHTDTTSLNTVGKQKMNADPNTLTANPLYRYVYESLVGEGVLEKRKGEKEGDVMNKYYAWMKAAGINLQNIIDHELAEILKRTPHAKVKFMAIRDENNATHDKDMFSHLMLVLDYDDKINSGITSIHNNEKNGGVIESQGKKYLIIGTVGYGNRNQDKLALYDILWNPYHPVFDLKTKRTQFFKKHADERFWVPEGLSTEVKPGSLIPGYIVRQSEIDSEAGVYRSVSELLEGSDKAVRNPTDKSFDKVAWGIQELAGNRFALVGTTLDKVMVPRDPIPNSGRAFVLMPAANGKLVPSYLKPLFYNEMLDGELKRQVDKWLEMVTYSDSDVAKAAKIRIKAIIELSKIFYFDVKKGDTIISRKSRNEISIIHDGQILGTFTLDNNFDRNTFLNTFREMNPRVNITLRVLNNKKLLRQWDEAGALTTDAAIFGVAGSAYEVYGLDSNGNMTIPKETGNPKPKISTSSDFRTNDRQQVIFKHNYYTVENGTYYLNGTPVTDTDTIKQLEYNKRVVDNQLVPVAKDKGWNYYILSTGEHPEVIKVRENTYEVKEATEEQAKQLIEKVTKEEAEKQRDEAAKATMEKALAEGTAKTTDVLSAEGESMLDPTTGDLIIPGAEETQAETPTEEGTGKKEKGSTHGTKQPTDIQHTSVDNINTGGENKSTQKFSTLYKDRTYFSKIRSIIKNKWKDAPGKVTELEEFLRKKDIEVDHIGTSKEDIEAWIHTLEDCRK